MWSTISSFTPSCRQYFTVPHTGTSLSSQHPLAPSLHRPSLSAFQPGILSLSHRSGSDRRQISRYPSVNHIVRVGFQHSAADTTVSIDSSLLCYVLCAPFDCYLHISASDADIVVESSFEDHLFPLSNSYPYCLDLVQMYQNAVADPR